MSLSKSGTGDARNSGRVIVGMGARGPSEMSLGEMQGQRDLTKWTSKTEEEYMTRVRDRATDAAKQIISQAMAKAAELREQGRAEGLEAATQEAQTLLDDLAGQQAQALGQALAALEEGGRTLWNQHRQDIVALVRLAVKKIVRLEMDSRREEMLGSVLDQALDAIDSHRQLVLKVSPDDEPFIGALMERAKQTYPGLDRWSVRADGKLSPGGMILESAEGMVDNSTESRWAAVEAVLDQLGLEAAPTQGASE